MVQFNYSLSRWNLLSRQTGRISFSFFFWKEVSSCLPALRGFILQGINTGDETLFWKDRWLNGRAPMCLWLDEFKDSQHPNDTVHNLIHLLNEPPFMENKDILHIKDRLRASDGVTVGKKWWMLKGNGFFR